MSRMHWIVVAILVVAALLLIRVHLAGGAI